MSRAPRHRHSPRVRRLAREAGINPDEVPGTGPSGRVTPADVASHVAASVPSGDPSGDLSRPAPTGAAVTSSDERAGAAAHTLLVEVDLSSVLSAVDRGAPGTKTIAFVTTAAAELLRQEMSTGAGISVESEDGAVVAIPDAADLSLAGLARRLGLDAPSSRPEDVARPYAFSVTSGVGGTDLRHALLELPSLAAGQVAVLSIGATTERPVVVRGGLDERLIAIRPMAYLSLVFDTNQLSRFDAARLLDHVRARLESTWPEEELQRQRIVPRAPE